MRQMPCSVVLLGHTVGESSAISDPSRSLEADAATPGSKGEVACCFQEQGRLLCASSRTFSGVGSLLRSGHDWIGAFRAQMSPFERLKAASGNTNSS